MREKEEPDGKILIGVVGPCGSGKSTLIAGLEQAGFSMPPYRAGTFLCPIYVEADHQS